MTRGFSGRWLRSGCVGLVLVASAAWADLFSPGELSRPHANFEGISNCTKCHPAGGQLAQETCLAPCHTELKPRIAAGKGLHGLIASDKRNCESCHHEHQGRDLQLVDWGAPGKKGFDHKRTGWFLKGAHSKTECDKCHEKRLISAPVVVKLLETRPKTLLGVGNQCESCHFDEHRGQQKEECSYCHNEVEWKKTPGFDHNTTEYPLKGKHIKVKCEKCHPSIKDDVRVAFPAPKSETFLKFGGIEHSACTDCHKDVHENRFGQRCASCHTVEGWTIIRNASAERQFHEKTRYPLKGAHLDVECKSCHGPFPGQAAKFKNMQFDECTDCHADAHEGQITVAAGKKTKNVDCTACHSVEAFVPTRFGLADHNKTKFTLEGAHIVVPCDACHTPTPALTAKIPKPVLVDLKRRGRRELFSQALFDFTKPTDTCETCHADVHKGQFTGKACTTCHQVASFEKVKFDHQKDSNYPLTGKHEKVACDKCHFVPTGSKEQVAGKPVVRYKPLEQKCNACHEDAHAGQFAKGTPAVTDCEQCHVTDDFKKTKFKHEPPFTTFVLDGQHEKVACAKCHLSVKVATRSDRKDVEVVKYRPLQRNCEACHSDFHKGAFQGFEP